MRSVTGSAYECAAARSRVRPPSGTPIYPASHRRTNIDHHPGGCVGTSPQPKTPQATQTTNHRPSPTLPFGEGGFQLATRSSETEAGWVHGTESPAQTPQATQTTNHRPAPTLPFGEGGFQLA